MTTTDLTGFRDLLAAKRAELSGSGGLEKIAIERSADPLEEVQSKSERELAIAGLNRESAIRRNIELALMIRINDRSFGTRVHCDEEIGRRRLQGSAMDSILHPLSGSCRPRRRGCSRKRRADAARRSLVHPTHPRGTRS